METTRPTSDRPLRVIAYTDVAAIGGAEISLGHLVTAVSDEIDVTVVSISEHVVDAIASGRTTDALHLWRTRMLSLRVDAHVAVGEVSARRMEDFYALVVRQGNFAKCIVLSPSHLLLLPGKVRVVDY